MPAAQKEHLERVSTKIGRVILEFYRERLEAGTPDFYMTDLSTYVQAKVPEVAPDSPRRVFNDLKNKGALNYELLSRRDSHYRLVALGPAAQETPMDPFELMRELL